MTRLSFVPSCIGLLFLACPYALAQDTERNYAWTCDGGRSGDLDTGETVCREFTFRDDTTDISAGIAMTSELGFEDHEWLLEDGLRIAYRDAEIAADSGRFVFRNDQLVDFALSGSPMELTIYIAEQDLEVNGTADSISYQVTDEIFRLNGDVVFIIGDNQDRITSCNLIFNLRDNSYDAGTTDNCGISMEGVIPGSETSSTADSDSQ